MELGENSETENPPNPPETKKIPDLDIDDTLTKANFYMPKTWYKRLGEIALQREVSRATLVREALREWFKKQETPIESNSNPKISNEDLNAIFRHCTTFFGGFNIDGDGFIQTMLQNDFKLKDLTQDQWKTVLKNLAIGYQGYFDTPTPEQWLSKFEPLEPTEQQLEDLLPEKPETETEQET